VHEGVIRELARPGVAAPGGAQPGGADDAPAAPGVLGVGEHEPHVGVREVPVVPVVERAAGVDEVPPHPRVEVGGVREPRGRGGRLPERAARPFRGGGEGRYRGGGDHAVARRARAKAPAAARTATTPASPATAATAPRAYASTGSASPRWARGRP